jgi:catalase
MTKKLEIISATGGNPITVGPRGLRLIPDYQLLEKLAPQNRKRSRAKH